MVYAGIHGQQVTSKVPQLLCLPLAQYLTTHPKHPLYCVLFKRDLPFDTKIKCMGVTGKKLWVLKHGLFVDHLVILKTIYTDIALII